MGIGNIGWSEFIVILAFALIFFGPRRLPGIAQSIGKSLREFQKALNEVKSEIAQAGREADAAQDVKRIAPRPADFLTPDPAIAESGPDEQAPEVAEGDEADMSPEASADEKGAQVGDS